MKKNEYGTFMNMKDIKKEFAIKSTTTMMRFVHRNHIPYIRETRKIILFETKVIMFFLEKLKNKACRYY